MADIEYTVGEAAVTVSFLGAQGPGVPAGGTAGQRLVKSSSDDYDTEWETAPAGEVESVNGETGVVVLDAADVGAAAASHSHTLSDVTDSGGAAALDVGTTAGTVAAGDHAHTGVYATAAQGGLADSAVQPGDLAAVATSGDYDDLANKPTLGTAAATDSTAYATAAQGSTADSATQPGDDAATLGSGASTDGQVLTSDGAGGAAWETPASGVTDHGLLSGLTDDDHTQYALADGSRGSFATTAQGGLADTATQPGDDADTLGSGDATDGHVLTADGAGGAAWEAPAGGGASTLNDLTDVSTAGASAGDAIVYGGSSWSPVAMPRTYVSESEPESWKDGDFWTKVTTVAADDFAGVVAATNPVAFYRGHGDGTDEEGGAAATLNTIGTGGVSLVPADSGASSLIVDNDADYIQSATWTNAVTAHSMMFAFKGDGTGSTRVLARCGGDKGALYLRNETVLRINDTGTSSVSLFDDEPHLVILTQSASTAYLYVDGELIQTLATAAVASSSYYWRWGDNTGFGGYTAGEYAEMAVWHSQLSEAQVNAITSRWLTTGTTGLTVLTRELWQRLYGAAYKWA